MVCCCLDYWSVYNQNDFDLVLEETNKLSFKNKHHKKIQERKKKHNYSLIQIIWNNIKFLKQQLTLSLFIKMDIFSIFFLMPSNK